ncbi:gamma-aminobutyric acid type B receptor subunit 2-like [Ptychodera flava]|uniref:gamma-aminobutyric acid type B receptor subunit 2-like n=1 Tax=Ptychodera flava TaxID=63121 RepID=UPI00396A259A
MIQWKGNRSTRKGILRRRQLLAACLVLSSGVCALASNTTSTEARDLYFAALFPFTSTGEESKIAWGVKVAINLALQHVNNSTQILNGYRLNMESYDTKCDMAEGTKALFEAMAEGPPKLMILGGICSDVTAPVAEAVLWWNMIQLSYANTEPFLSEREKYPTFFRTVPSETDFNPAKLKLLDHFNWTRVATIHQDTPRFSMAHSKLSSALESVGKKLILVASFTEDPEKAVKDVKDSGARIILGYFDERMARRIFCQAFKNRVFGSRYVWIIPGWYSENWWDDIDLQSECTLQQVTEAIRGYLATDMLSLAKTEEPTVSGLTPYEYHQRYRRLSGSNYTVLHGYAYDGVWVIAAAIDRVLKQWDNASTLTSTFNYGNDQMFQVFMEAMNETDFVGVTGPVRFKDGDRLGTIVYEQYQDGKEIPVGEYYAYSDGYRMTDNILWEGGSPPADQPIIKRYPHAVSFILYVIMGSLSYLGIMVALMFLFFNMKFRKHRFIKMSSPFLNNLIIIGGILCYGSIYFLGLDGTYLNDHEFSIICTVKSWMIATGFTIAFGAMFSKTWRVYSIFTNIKMKKKVIRDYRLFGIVGVLLMVDVVILLSWGLKDPLQRKVVEGPEQPDPGGRDSSIILVMHHCESVHMTIWLAAIYIYKGVLMIFGCFLAWETRHVNIPALNDSKYIGMSVYNVVVMCTVGGALSFVIRNNPNAAFVIMSLFILFSTTITLCLVFVPKILELKRDPKGEDRKIRCTTSKGSLRIPPSSSSTDFSDRVKCLNAERIRLNRLLEEKDREVSFLLEQIGSGNSMMSHPSEADIARSVSATLLLNEERGHSYLPRSRDGNATRNEDVLHNPMDDLEEFTSAFLPSMCHLPHLS